MTVQKTVDFPQLPFSDKALTMSSRSFVGAKMQVKVSIGSCARWVTFAWRLALSMLRVSVRGLSCRVTLRLGDSRDPTVAARFFSDQVVDIPVVSTTGAGVEVQKTATVPQLQHIRQGGRYPCWRSSSTRYGRLVIMQRRQVSCWRCLRFCSSPELVDIQLCGREWYSTWRLWRR